MAIKPRNFALNAAVGVAIAALIIVGIFAAGIRFPTARAGSLLVLLTDAPVELEKLDITITDFAVHRVGEGWIAVPPNIDHAFDLLALQGGITMMLAESTTMPLGTYNKLRLTVGSAIATVEGKEVPLTVPPGHIDVIIRFDVENEETTVLLVDMEADPAAINQSNRLRPVIKVSVPGQEPPPET